MSSDNSIESTEGGSLTFPSTAGKMKKGNHMLIKGFPCKVVSVSTSKTGKHGHAKSAITGLCLFTGKKCEDSIPSSHNVDCPNVTKTEYALINILEDNFLSLMDDESGEVTEDLKLSDHKHWAEMNEKLVEDFEAGHEIMVTVLDAMDQKCVIAYRKTS